MRVVPSKGTPHHENDWRRFFEIINGNSWLYGLDASYSPAALSLALTEGWATINGYYIGAATNDLQTALPPRSIRYIYLYLSVANRGRNAVRARLVALAEPQNFFDAILLYKVITDSAGVTAVQDLRIKELANRYAIADLTLPSDVFDSVSLDALTERTVTGTTETEVKQLKVANSGTALLTCQLKRSSGTGTLNVYTTSGGGAPVGTSTATAGTYATKTLAICINAGDIVSVKLKASGASYTVTIKDVRLQYKLGIPPAPSVLLD